MELAPHTPFVLFVVVGTQTPFCNIELVPQILVGGGWLVLGRLFSMIIQRLDSLNICLPLPKMLWPLFSQGCAKVGEVLNAINAPSTNSDAVVTARRFTETFPTIFYIKCFTKINKKIC
jgi:hypothetical protein